MRRLSLIMLLATLLVGVSQVIYAAPFLTCDCSVPTDNITGAKLQLNTGAWFDVPVVTSCGNNPATKVTCTAPAVTICYDLASLPTGPFTVKGRFVNSWGESADSDPFVGTKALPGKPITTHLVQ